jgi:hypothetical protein
MPIKHFCPITSRLTVIPLLARNEQWPSLLTVAHITVIAGYRSTHRPESTIFAILSKKPYDSHGDYALCNHLRECDVINRIRSGACN